MYQMQFTAKIIAWGQFVIFDLLKMARRPVRNVLLCDAMTLLRSFRLQYENNKQPYEEKRKRTCRKY